MLDFESRSSRWPLLTRLKKIDRMEVLFVLSMVTLVVALLLSLPVSMNGQYSDGRWKLGLVLFTIGGLLGIFSIASIPGMMRRRQAAFVSSFGGCGGEEE